MFVLQVNMLMRLQEAANYSSPQSNDSDSVSVDSHSSIQEFSSSSVESTLWGHDPRCEDTIQLVCHTTNRAWFKQFQVPSLWSELMAVYRLVYDVESKYQGLTLTQVTSVKSTP